MKNLSWLILVGFIFTMVAGCVVAGPTMAPPPAKKEVRTARPGPNYVWITGHWNWSSGRYVWIRGHWVKNKPGKNWVPGHWTKKGRRYVWIKGHWR